MNRCFLRPPESFAVEFCATLNTVSNVSCRIVGGFLVNDGETMGVDTITVDYLPMFDARRIWSRGLLAGRHGTQVRFLSGGSCASGVSSLLERDRKSDDSFLPSVELTGYVVDDEPMCRTSI